MDTFRRKLRELDYGVIVTTVLLTAVGCIAIMAATQGKTGADIPSHAWVKQMTYGIVGAVAMTVMMILDYRTLRKFRWWFYGGTTLMLAAVLKLGHVVNGAKSWFQLGPLSFQPSEFAKLSLILMLAAYMADVDEREFPEYSWKTLWPVAAFFVPPFLLTLKEPALGQALVMFAITLTMVVVFVKRSFFWLLTTAFVSVVSFTAVMALQFPIQAYNFIETFMVQKHHLIKPYQADRILAWLNQQYDPLGAGFNVLHAQIAIGSGQVFGEGFLNGSVTRGGFVPNQWTDYIFSAIGEEFGFIGAVFVVILFLMLMHQLVRISRSSQDSFGTYMLIGFVGMFAFQVFENIGMDIYMSPSTGITLPFISYGGTSLLANFMAIGVALSVSLRKKKLRFS